MTLTSGLSSTSMASWLDSMGSSASGCVEGSESSCDEEVSMMEAEAHEDNWGREEESMQGHLEKRTASGQTSRAGAMSTCPE